MTYAVGLFVRLNFRYILQGHNKGLPNVSFTVSAWLDKKNLTDIRILLMLKSPLG